MIKVGPATAEKNTMSEDERWPSATQAAMAATADSWLQTITEVATRSYEIDTPEAWQAVATAAAKLSEMAQTLAAVADAKQTAEELARTAEEANRTAQDRARAADDAKQTAEELAQTAEEANRTAQDRARAAADAKQTAEELAQTAEEANRTAQDRSRAAAEARERLIQLETIAAKPSETNAAAAWVNGHQGVVDNGAETVTIVDGPDQAPRSWAEGTTATQPSAGTPRRRLLPREPERQLVKYRIEDDAYHRWRPCRLTDISVAGAGLELLESTPAVSVGRTITLMIEDEADVRLVSGEIRQVTETADGTLRIGLRFVELSGATQKHIESLRQLNIRW